MAEGTQPVRKFKIPAVILYLTRASRTLHDGWLWGRNNANPTVEGSQCSCTQRQLGQRSTVRNSWWLYTVASKYTAIQL